MENGLEKSVGVGILLVSRKGAKHQYLRRKVLNRLATGKAFWLVEYSLFIMPYYLGVFRSGLAS